MNSRSSLALALVSTLTLVGVSACARDLDTLGPAPFPTNAAVFVDGFGPGVQFQAFLGTNQAGGDPESFVLDEDDTFSGATSIRIKVPTPGDPAGGFAGGVLATSVPRDLTGYDALTFWAKASTNVSLDLIGLGNDNTGTSRFPAERTGIQLTTSWQKIIMPIPLASRLEMEGGLFTFADGADGGNGYTIWFDELQYEDTGLLANPRPSIPTQTFVGSVGSELAIAGTQVIIDVNGTDATIGAAPAYFTYASSNPTAATVDEDGNIAVVGEGTAVVTASLGSVAAAGEITVTTDAGGTEPAAPAPTPTVDPLNVVSMFSNAYTNVAVDTWSAGFDMADLEDIQIAGNDVKKYTNLVFAAAEATTTPIDASAMTRFHMDIWTPDATAAPAVFKVKLVDFGADGAFQGGDDTEHELTFNDTSTPPLATGTWVSIDVPMTDFAGLTAQAHLAQFILSGDPNTVFVDNVYFYNDAGGGGGGGTGGDGATGGPFAVSFDDPGITYTLTDFGDASSALEPDPADAGNTVARTTKLVTAMTWAGTTVGGVNITYPLSVTETQITMRVRSPDAGIPVRMKVETAGDPTRSVETEAVTTVADAWETLTFDFANEAPGTAPLNPAFTYDMLSVFFNFDTDGATAGEKTYYWDTIEFLGTGGGGGGGGAPVVAAPTPTQAAGDVVSMFSNAYTNVAVDTWSAGFDMADLEDIQIAGDDVKKYTNLVFVGIEATTTPIDASAMTDFHMDIWTPDATAAPAVFKVKLVDFGADGAFGGGDDTEHELTFNDTSTPPLATGAWVGIDVPMTDFAGLTAQTHIAQMILSGDPNTVFVDNVYFYNSGGGGGGGGGTGGDGATGGPFAVSFDDPGITYTLTDFGDASSALEPDPADAGNTVARTTKLVTAMTWAGTTVGGVNITYPLSVTETQITMRVRSPDADIPVRMKVETAGDPTRSVETEAVTTVADAWETLTFDFANEAPGTAPLNPAFTYDMLSVFFNFDTDGATAGEKTYYWDTIEFLGTGGGGGGGGAPVVAAPTPTQAAGDVVSMFSNAYTDVTVDTWSAGWDNADVEDTQIAGDDVKKYTNLAFAGIEATAVPIDASAMTDFHMDIWTPDATAAPAVFKVKLVDFGADGAFGGGDDTEHELTFNDTSTPPLATGAWVGIDVPLTDFAGLLATGHIAQMIISGDPNTVFVDNVYFYK